MKVSRHTPMLWVLLHLIFGIAASRLWALPSLFAALLLLLVTLLTIFSGRLSFIYSSIFLFGYFVSSLCFPSGDLEQQTDAVLLVELSQPPAATVIGIQDPGGEWRESQHSILISSHEALTPYSSLIVKGDVAPIEDSSNGYLRTQKLKGYTHRLKVNEIISCEPLPAKPLSTRANEWGLERLLRLQLNPQAFDLAAAVGLAHRESLKEDVVESYNRSGAAHLLALSGLHVGIIVLLVSACCFYLPLLRNGHIVADLLLIVAIWLFALLAGGGLSVIRACSMFSLLTLSRLISRRYNSLNSLFAAAVVILSLDPASLYDLGFQLSFVAVAAIIVVGAPLCSMLSSGHYLLDVVVSSLVIGTVATTATAPLISHTFGYVALLSPIITLPLLLTLSVIITSTLLWVIFPLPLLSPIFWWTLEVATTIQNYIVGWAASWGFGYLDYQLSKAGVSICYLILAVAGYLITLLIENHYKEESIRDFFARARKSH